MKDYSLNEFQRQFFVLNYEIKNDEIIINLASGDNITVPYSRENEDTILDRMKYQVINSDHFADLISYKFKTFVIPMGLFLGYGGAAINIYNDIIAMANGQELNHSTGSGFIIGLCLGMAISQTKKGIKYYKLLVDIDKNNLFHDNSFYMNYNMRIEDKYLVGLSSTTKEIIRNTREGDNIFTFNSIDKMSYHDVKKVLENIEKYNPREEDYTPRSKQRKRR